MISLAARAEMSFAWRQCARLLCGTEERGHADARPGGESFQGSCAKSCPLGLVFPQQRIYIEFTNADGAMWGWNGGTFG